MQPNRLIGGRYRVVRKIAEGGMGAVYEAQHNLSKKTVALKILFPHIGKDEASRQRFLREVSAPAQIGHDGIVEVYDAGFDDQDGSLFVAMELLQGEPLRDRLDRGGIPVDALLRMFEEILEPLAMAHQKGIVHRDLKPENIFVTTNKRGEEVLKILDFGIARDLDASASNVTHTGIAMGTPHYMAPEQAMSARGVSASADVWALGVMLYEALAGRTPFDGETASAIVVHACTQAHAPLAQVAPQTPAELATFVDRCLSKEPGERPADAGQMLAGLREVRQRLAGGGGSTRPIAPTRLQQAVTPSQVGSGVGPAGGTPGSAPGFPSAPGVGSAPGYTPPPGAATAPNAGWGTPPPSSGPNFGAPPSAQLSAPAAGYVTPPAAPPGSARGRGLAIGGAVAALLGLAVVVLGGAGAAAYVYRDQLFPAPAGTVEIDANVSGTVFVDGEELGPLGGHREFDLPAGNHRIELRQGDRGLASAQVRVVAGQHTIVPLTAVATGQPQVIQGSIAPGDMVLPSGKLGDRYEFQWPAGGLVHIEANGTTGLDTFLTVVTPSGQRFENDDLNGLNAGLDVSLTQAGRYEVIVTTYQQGMTGPYNLVIRGL